MFDTNISRDEASKKTTRRVFLGGGVAVIASYAAMRIFGSRGIAESPVIHGTPGHVTIVDFSDDGGALGRHSVPKVLKTDGSWYRQLGRSGFGIARQADTEIPFSGATWKEHRRGLYRCICCATALFSSQTKFESGTGWPSFWAPLAKENIAEKTDVSLGFERTEVTCARCEGHLGHVFTDGPQPTGLRYCMNSASMEFKKA